MDAADGVVGVVGCRRWWCSLSILYLDFSKMYVMVSSPPPPKPWTLGPLLCLTKKKLRNFPFPLSHHSSHSSSPLLLHYSLLIDAIRPFPLPRIFPPRLLFYDIWNEKSSGTLRLSPFIQKTRVKVWLFEQPHTWMEGRICVSFKNIWSLFIVAHFFGAPCLYPLLWKWWKKYPGQEEVFHSPRVPAGFVKLFISHEALSDNSPDQYNNKPCPFVYLFLNFLLRIFV